MQDCNWATDSQQLHPAASSSKQQQAAASSSTQQAVASSKQHAAVATHPGAHGLPAVAAGGIPAHKHSVRTSNEPVVAMREKQTPPLGSLLSTCSRGASQGKVCQAAGQQPGVLAWLWCHASAAVQCMQAVHSAAQHSTADAQSALSPAALRVEASGPAGIPHSHAHAPPHAAAAAAVAAACAAGSTAGSSAAPLAAAAVDVAATVLRRHSDLHLHWLGRAGLCASVECASMASSRCQRP